jgi:hypothetical protein
MDLTDTEEASMSDREWNVGEFVARFRDGEFDGQLGDTLESLSPGQIGELQRFLMSEGEKPDGILPED